jgi:hypothetical protein
VLDILEGREKALCLDNKLCSVDCYKYISRKVHVCLKLRELVSSLAVTSFGGKSQASL